MERCEPWNNSFQLDGDTESVLRRLAIVPLSRAEIERSLLANDEIVGLVTPAVHEQVSDGLIRGLFRFVMSLGRSTAFSDAIQDQLHRAEAYRQSVDWSTIPEPLRARCARRATVILEHAQNGGWAGRDGDLWVITDVGRELLRVGGFSMR